MREDQERLRVGLVGYGQIGRQVARRILHGDVPQAVLAGVTSRRGPARRDRGAGGGPSWFSLEELAQRAEVLVEAASPDIVPDLIGLAVEHQLAVVILSGCALLLQPQLLRCAEEAGIHVAVPSAAVAGLDALIAARAGRVDDVVLAIRRPCSGIERAPYVLGSGIPLDELAGETLIFEGTAREACLGFPGKTNIAASVALAGIGDDATRVRVYADPERTVHEHCISIEGDFGTGRSCVTFDARLPDSVDSLMALSVVASLRQMVSRIRFCT